MNLPILETWWSVIIKPVPCESDYFPRPTQHILRLTHVTRILLPAAAEGEQQFPRQRTPHCVHRSPARADGRVQALFRPGEPCPRGGAGQCGPRTQPGQASSSPGTRPHPPASRRTGSRPKSQGPERRGRTGRGGAPSPAQPTLPGRQPPFPAARPARRSPARPAQQRAGAGGASRRRGASMRGRCPARKPSSPPGFESAIWPV